MSKNITDSISWIGSSDPTLDLFESQYKVPEGVTYNSYVIEGDKIAVMDTVDKRKSEEWLANLKEVLNGRQPDYLVVQHLEPDHSADIDVFLKEFPQGKLVLSKKALDMLPNFIKSDVTDRTVVVADGSELDLGNRKLHFITAPMVHWPEVIMTYDDKDKVLFSADGFGRFGNDDESSPWDDQARRYYFNIVGKYGAPVQGVLRKAAKLDIEKIAPLHGPVLTKDLSHYLEKYSTWSSYKPEEEGIFIAVASIHGHTNEVAAKMEQILKDKGQNVVLMDLTREDVHTAVANAFKYNKTLLIACSYDAGVFPPMERMLSILSHKAFQNRTIAMIENGSWAPSAAKTMKELLSGCKNLTLVEPVVTIRTSLKSTDIPKLEELADNLIAA